MAKITGIISDYGMGHLVGLHPTLLFTPSGPSLGNTRIFAPHTEVIAPIDATGYFEAELQPTEDLNPAVHYVVTVRWGAGRRVVLPWRLTVPPAGGVLSELLPVLSNPANVWVGVEPPENPSPGVWWLNPITGELQEWSA